jgi:hypothetical protein
MKKLIVSMIALLLLIGGTVNAQNQTRRTPEERAKTQADAVKTALTLTEEQNAKVYAILLVTSKQIDSVMTANAGGDRSAMMGLMKPISDARDAKIKTVLTPDQAVQFEAKKADLFSFRRPAPVQQ